MKGEGLSAKITTATINSILTPDAKEMEDKVGTGEYNKHDEEHGEIPGCIPVMTLPLQTLDDKIVGVIQFSHSYACNDRHDGVFNESDEPLANVIAHLTGAVLSTYPIWDKLQTLIHIGRQLLIVSPTNIDEMLNKAVSLAADTLQCDRISIWLKDKTSKRIVLRAACGGLEKFIEQELFYDLDVIDEESGMKGEGLTGKVAADSIEKIRAPSTRNIKGWKGKYDHLEEGHVALPGSFPEMILPLLKPPDNNITGVVKFISPRPRMDRPDGTFNDADEDFALVFAQLIGIAIESAQLVQEVTQREKMAVVGKLASGVAHEIRNPLAVIKGQVDLLFDELSGNGAAFEHLRIIQDRVDVCLQNVRALQTFGRMGSPKFESVCLIDELEKAVKMFHTDISQKLIHIIKNYTTPLPDIIADSSQLNQLFFNILQNAIQAMPDCGTIEIQTARVDNREAIEIQIRDSGIGMSADVQKRVLEPYFTTKAACGGTGMGLSICYGIVQQHEGTLTLHSEPGKGTTVIITLPIKER